jgi:hypothetical protein
VAPAEASPRRRMARAKPALENGKHGADRYSWAACAERAGAGVAVRAGGAGVHADHRRDGGHQPRARLALRAGGVRGGGARHAGRRPPAGGARAVLQPARPDSVRRGAAARARPGRRRRHGAGGLPAPHLRAGSAVRAAADVRRRAGAGGADPAGVGADRAVPAAAGRHHGRHHARRPDLLRLPLLRLRLRHRDDRAPGSSSSARATAPSSRPARTTARWCARSA